MPRRDDPRRDWLNHFVDVLQDSTNGLAAKYNVDAGILTELD